MAQIQSCIAFPHSQKALRATTRHHRSWTSPLLWPKSVWTVVTCPSVITELLYLHIRGYRITMSKIIHCTTRSTPAFVIREERILFFMILWLAYYDSHCYQFSRALLRNMMLATHRNPLPATLIKCYPIRLLSCCSFNFSLSLNYAV